MWGRVILIFNFFLPHLSRSFFLIFFWYRERGETKKNMESYICVMCRHHHRRVRFFFLEFFLELLTIFCVWQHALKVNRYFRCARARIKSDSTKIVCDYFWIHEKKYCCVFFYILPWIHIFGTAPLTITHVI
jgi:hypothetical protein